MELGREAGKEWEWAVLISEVRWNWELRGAKLEAPNYHRLKILIPTFNLPWYPKVLNALCLHTEAPRQTHIHTPT